MVSGPTTPKKILLHNPWYWWVSYLTDNVSALGFLDLTVRFDIADVSFSIGFLVLLQIFLTILLTIFFQNLYVPLHL